MSLFQERKSNPNIVNGDDNLLLPRSRSSPRTVVATMPSSHLVLPSPTSAFQVLEDSSLLPQQQHEEEDLQSPLHDFLGALALDNDSSANENDAAAADQNHSRHRAHNINESRPRRQGLRDVTNTLLT